MKIEEDYDQISKSNNIVIYEQKIKVSELDNLVGKHIFMLTYSTYSLIINHKTNKDKTSIDLNNGTKRLCDNDEILTIYHMKKR
jgi:hypothetical protein